MEKRLVLGDGPLLWFGGGLFVGVEFGVEVGAFFGGGFVLLGGDGVLLGVGVVASACYLP